jgi:hypothetical protein
MAPHLPPHPSPAATTPTIQAPPVPVLACSRCACALFLSRSWATLEVAPVTGRASPLPPLTPLLHALPVVVTGSGPCRDGSVAPASARRGAPPHHRRTGQANFDVVPAVGRASPSMPMAPLLLSTPVARSVVPPPPSLLPPGSAPVAHPSHGVRWIWALYWHSHGPSVRTPPSALTDVSLSVASSPPLL